MQRLLLIRLDNFLKLLLTIFSEERSRLVPNWVYMDLDGLWVSVSVQVEKS
jgi:hypothetical protein